jgi:hypothetical protein
VKPVHRKPSPPRRLRRGAGRAKTNQPKPGWPTHSDPRTLFVNSRVPSVPSTLDLRLNEYFAGAIVMGLMASATREPNKSWAKKWSFDFGEDMQAEALRRRRSQLRDKRTNAR